MKRISISILLFVFIISSLIFGAGETIEILNGNSSAWAEGVGGAITGASGEVDNIYHNPAGLGMLKGMEIGGFHSFLYFDTSYDCIGIAADMKSIGVIGIGGSMLSTDAIQKTDETGNVIGQYGYNSLLLVMAYGKEVVKGVSFGVNAKYIYEKMDDEKGMGFSGDVGMMWKPLKGLNIGVVFKDIWSTPYEWSTSRVERLPSYVRLGGRLRLPILPLIFYAEVEKELRFESQPAYRFGGEIDMGMVKFYGGVNEDMYAAGIGMMLGNLSIDYAYRLTQDIGGVNEISMKVKW